MATLTWYGHCVWRRVRKLILAGLMLSGSAFAQSPSNTPVAVQVPAPPTTERTYRAPDAASQGGPSNDGGADEGELTDEKNSIREPSPSGRRRFSDNPFAAYIRAGIGGPMGLVGGMLSLDVLDRLSIGAGAGTNFEGPQLAALMRVRPVVWEGHEHLLRAVAIELSFSTGPSTGGYIPAGEGYGAPFSWQRISWVQFEGQYEVRLASGLSFIAGAGFALPLANSGNPSCRRNASEGACTNETPIPQPSGSLTGAIGYAF